ncbi:MAG TPA: hypothetical protein PLR54_02830 [Spirochaetota bacterium]|jgi:hypothetical protein|nr:hypothetical protein [Spirochaetota bacterium]HOM87305.1 hypothetical protein [Spirochaetota bacterium]HOT20114.1 hypothetical protein [Spirochaetota bacterium]HPD04771.1 hypothetical protein [Spirochaetota bacterium]HPK45301.1 hypothetical protein [Spirochaetota bacterium]
MERTDIWYCTDNDKGKEIYETLKLLGLNIVLVEDKNFSSCNVLPSQINIFIIDLVTVEFSEILSMLRKDERLHKFIKYLILFKKQIRKASQLSIDVMHLEILSRPIKKREFSLLLEKSIIVERYKEMLNLYSLEATERIEAYTNLLDINRKESFFDEKEKNIFSKIINFEKHILKEQKELNVAIANYTRLRQKELFDLKKRIDAEEMLSELRRKELMDAKSVIEAQSAVIEYSSKELQSAEEIIHATEAVQELSRLEAIKLHEELEKEKKKNEVLQKKIDMLEKKINNSKS